MEDLSSIFQRYLSQSSLNKFKIGDTDVYEYSNTPTARRQRQIIIDNIIENLQSNDNFGEYFITKKSSVKLETKSLSSGNKNTPLILLIRESEKRGSKVLVVLKLVPKAKFRLSPSNLGITRSGSPGRRECYLSFDQIISLIESKVTEYVNEEQISESLGEWIKVHLAMFNPSDLSTGKRQRIRDVWDDGLLDEITSELLEIFCGLGYIKAITSPFNNQGSINSVAPKERGRVEELIGTNPNINSFRIWFPQAGNYPIIDSQVGYFENNVLKAVFPISTKNVTGNRTPNVIKFKDIFTNKKQVFQWKKQLPRKVALKQGVQSVVAAQAVGQKRGQDALYPLYASKSILQSTITSPTNKRRFLDDINEYGSHFTEQQVKTLLSQLTRSRHSKKEKLEDFLTGDVLKVSKGLIYILLKNTLGTGSSYAPIIRRFDKDYLLTISEEIWNSVVKGRSNAEYPFTYENISLFFEKVLENNSVYKNGPTQYLRIVTENYFTTNRSLIAKYGSDVPPSGAGDVILSKVSIQQDGLAKISYNTKTNPASNYGLRSKNSLNDLQDALGIAP
jgi:hypothetical protein